MVADAIGLPLDSGKARGELAMASRETIAAGTLAAGTVAAQRITVSGIRAGFELIRFRATWYCSADLDPRMGWHVGIGGQPRRQRLALHLRRSPGHSHDAGPSTGRHYTGARS
jgi:hypothetical protein